MILAAVIATGLLSVASQNTYLPSQCYHLPRSFPEGLNPCTDSILRDENSCKVLVF